MNTDIRLHCSFKEHRKRRRLRVWLGDRATDYLIDLWLTAAEERPLGVLSAWDEKDIALAAGYPDDPQKFIEALIDSKLLEQKDGVYCLHDWQSHQPWAVKADERSEISRRNALKRWHPNGEHADGMQPPCEGHAKGNGNGNAKRCPSAPSPLPLPRNTNVLLSKPPISPKGFDEFWKAYPKKKSKGHAEKAFKKAQVDEQLLKVILTALERAKKSPEWLKDGGQFIPHPATWLNAKGWLDEEVKRMANHERVPAAGYTDPATLYSD